MTVRLLADRPPYKAGDLFTSDANTEQDLIDAKEASATLTGGTTFVPPRNPAEPVNFNPSDVSALQALVSGDGTTGIWRQMPAAGPVMRVRITGTGTVSMDSATGDLGAGTVTTAAYTNTVSGTQIDDYAYPGDAARSIRFNLTGTAAVEVY